VSFAESIVYIAAIASAAVVVDAFIRALWPVTPPAALENRALVELALLREEVSKLRAEGAKDVEEIREVLGKHERSFVNVTHQVNDCIKETSKLSLAYGNAQQVRR
jgi:hypothetical protein